MISVSELIFTIFTILVSVCSLSDIDLRILSVIMALTFLTSYVMLSQMAFMNGALLLIAHADRH